MLTITTTTRVDALGHRAAQAETTLASHHSTPLQEQYEGRVLSLVIRDLASVAPAAGEGTVMEIVADVWCQAEEHLARAGRTGWAHISWFVQNATASFARRQPMAGC
ncbi:hypothetical protein [Kitasatospora sp. NPDC058218]|uniref:hypothetical protein n=1 Tax=Kitasatospora sp. NPDC058218 TaxID=3346385 RepID=UPI0036D9B47C